MISIIVPVYNAEKYLDQCIQSILAQTYTDFELLLINDGSTDSSGAICDKYAEQDPRVRVFHKENGGVSSARNLGLEQARGEWIGWVDADDRIVSTMLAQMLAKAIENHADCVLCDSLITTDAGETTYSPPLCNKDKKEFLNKWIASEWTVLWNILAKKSIYTRRELSFPSEIQFCEDFYLAIQLLLHANTIERVQSPLYNYNRLNLSSILHTERKEKMWADSEWVYYDVIRILKENGLFEMCAQGISWRFLNTMQYCVLDGKYFNKFKLTHPETHRYIWKCPYLNGKIKLMMYCLDKNLDFIVSFFVWLRMVFKRA